jgi:cytosine/creatinine deaminase
LITNLIDNFDSYWLLKAHIPLSFLPEKSFQMTTRDGLCLVDLEIERGVIKQAITSGSQNLESKQQIDLQKKIILPCFVDVHTHLDKGHIWQRSPNIDGTFNTALETAIQDSQQYWQYEDVYRRMKFSLKSAYAHGTKAIRTHIDSFGEQADLSLKVFADLQQQWQGKIELQAVSLVSLDYYQTCQGVALADRIKKMNGILGGVLYIQPEIDSQIDAVFELAAEKNLDLDFHVDENGDPDSICLQKVAEAAIRHNFQGKIVCGHCCSLAVQSPEQVAKTIDLVQQANMAIVSLPMCNLYLQDRQYNSLQKPITPYWRGITRVHELQQNGVEVAFASDNIRDPFYGFGDLDMLEVFEQAVRIAHLDRDYNYWINSVTKTPAEMMGLTDTKITPNMKADLVIFPGRYYSELLSRSQHEKIVLRGGKAIDTTLPDYAELDDLILNDWG